MCAALHRKRGIEDAFIEWNTLWLRTMSISTDAITHQKWEAFWETHGINKYKDLLPLLQAIYEDMTVNDAAADMRYFGRSKLSRSLVHKKNFSLILQAAFKLGYVFCQTLISL